MGAPEIQAFLSYLANERNVSLSTHHQALCALLFLYKNVLQIDLSWLDSVRPGKAVRRPTVLTRQEIDLVFAQMEDLHLLIARLLYGSGIRIMECVRLPGRGCGLFARRDPQVGEVAVASSPSRGGSDCGFADSRVMTGFFE